MPTPDDSISDPLAYSSSDGTLDADEMARISEEDSDGTNPETVEEYQDDEATRIGDETRTGSAVSERSVFYRPILIGLAGPNKGMRHQINNHLTIIGRSSSSTWKLNDHTASRQHFQITYDNHIAPDQPPVCYVEDMNSRNGTEVNGEKIKGLVVLNERDRISVGSSVVGYFVRDDEELKQDQSLYLNATQDPLTGLKNRRILQQYLKYHIKQADRYGLPLSMILIDIDFFKKVNDTHGHDVGDDALCHMADILRINCREDDLLSRWGGEEFAIAMSGVPADQSQKLAERLRETTELTPMDLNSTREDSGVLSMTISIGGTQYIPGESVDTLFHRCDQALYEAKKTGRNKVVFA